MNRIGSRLLWYAVLLIPFLPNEKDSSPASEKSFSLAHLVVTFNKHMEYLNECNHEQKRSSKIATV